MPQIPPIDDNYIDEVIKSTEPYNPAINKTQGVKLRELIKKLRDYFEQEMPKKISELENDAHFVANETLTALLADINNAIVQMDVKTDANADAIAAVLAGSNSDSDSLAKLYNLIIKGINEKTFATIVERNVYNVTSLPFQAFVSDDGDGKWALYRATSTGVNANYIKISDPDLLNAVMSSAAVKIAYESNANTNSYTDADKAKVAGLDAALNTKVTGTLANDAENQIISALNEDSKFVSRLKLFNWWAWIKTQAQSLTGNWIFNGSLTFGSSGYFTSDSTRFYMRAYASKRLNIGVEGIGADSITIDSSGVQTVHRLSLATGTATTPPLVIPSGTLITIAQSGAIERDANGELWSTKNNGRYKIIVDDGTIITMIFNQLNNMQNDITGKISDNKQIISDNTTVGKMQNTGVYRVNTVDEVYYPGISSGVNEPSMAKSEIYLKINNGYFANHFSGSSPVDMIKLIEYNGFNNNGYKTNQLALVSNVQNPDISKAQWSTISCMQTVNVNGVITTSSGTYYLRDAGNTRTFGASEAIFSFVIKNTVQYSDATNANGANINRTIRLNNYGLYIEKIK